MSATKPLLPSYFDAENLVIGAANTQKKDYSLDGEDVTVTTDKVTGGLCILNEVDEDSLNPVTGKAVAEAIAQGGGGSSYEAGDGISIADDEISVKVDGTTIDINASGELEAIGGGGGGSIPHINAQGTLSSGEIQVNVGTSLTSGCWLGFITTEEYRGIPVGSMPFTENDLILVSAHSENYDVNIGAVFHPYVWTSGSTAGYYVQCMFNAWVSDPTDRTWKFTFKKQDGTDITTALANNEIWFNLYKMS